MNLATLRLARTEGVGPVTYRRLLARFHTAEDALAALPELAASGGRASPLRVHPERDAERELAALRRLGGRMVFLGEPDYPPLLALLADAPPCLSVLGDLAALQRAAVGIVGGRNASANGLRVAEALATDLAASFVVVSGLARGIDAAAHEGALHVGQTIAAIAGGIDVPYPPEHAALQARVAERGAVVAEAPLGTAPQSRHFPRRNRVIAGLSLGVVVVEAAPQSGSLITARLALEADREVFAVPGSPLDPRCRGSNNLIREGAHLTESAADVRANLPPAPQPRAAAQAAFGGFADTQTPWDAPPEPEADERAAREAVVALLSPAPTAVDDLLRHCHFSASAVMAALTQLELAGRIEPLPGNRVCLLDA